MMKRLLLVAACFLAGFGCNASEKLATQIIDDTGIDKGLCVILGCSDVSLAVELSKQTKLIVQMLDPDAKKVEKAREKIGKLYCSRLSAEQNPMDKLGFADYLINLVVVSDVNLKGLSAKEIMRILRPYGVAYIGAKFDGVLKSKLSKIKGVRIIRKNGVWAKIIKPRPKEMADWGHISHDATKNQYSEDKLAGPPFHLQWAAEPIMFMATAGGIHAYTATPITANGYLYFIDAIKRDYKLLYAVDAHNGTKLWERKIPSRGGTYIAVGDVLYSTFRGKGTEVIDAKTGEVKDTFKQSCSFYYQGLLYGNYKGDLYAVDPKTGKIKWEDKKAGRIICFGDNRIYLYPSKDNISAFDASTGKKIWDKTHEGVVGNWSGLPGLFSSGVLYIRTSGKPGLVIAISGRDGSELWKIDGRGRGSYVVIGNKIYSETTLGNNMGLVGFDTKTGKDLGTLPHVTYRCTSAAGVGDWVLYVGGTCASNVKTKESLVYDVGRTTCRSMLLSGNGLTYAMPGDCFCGNSMKGVIAFSNTGDWRPGKIEDDIEKRFKKGPAFGSSSRGIKNKDNWNSFRKDFRNSAKTSSKVGLPLKENWNNKVKGKPTPPSVADGRVFVGTDDNKVYCFDAKTGKALWTYITDGAVISTPTVYEGLVLIGSLGGGVYCLQAETGKLAWRFRAAPERRKIMMYGHITSAWPVSGGVIIVNDTAYFYAGRASNDGVFLYAVNPRTGNILWKRNDIGFAPGKNEGLSPFGIMVSDEKNLYIPGGFAQPVPFSIRDGERVWKPIGSIGHGSYYNKRGGDRLTLNKDLLLVRQDNANGWNRAGRHYIYRTNSNKGVESNVEGESFEEVKKKRGKTGAMSLQGSRHGPVVFFDDEIYATEWVEAGTTITGATTSLGTGHRGMLMLDVKWTLDTRIFVNSAIVADNTYLCSGNNHDNMEINTARFGMYIRPKKDKNKNGKIIAISKDKGRKFGEWDISGVPVKDGIAAAEGKLYISCEDGKIICMGKDKR